MPNSPSRPSPVRSRASRFDAARGRRAWVVDCVPLMLVVGLCSAPARAAGITGTEVSSLAVGDFDGDGQTDYAYGFPKWNSWRGKAVVVYGTEKIDVWSRDSPGILGDDVNYNYFGDSVAAGDFNGDGYDDLAVGVPGDDEPSITNVGSLHVIYGSSSGLTDSGDQLITQDTWGVADVAEGYDYYAEVLATGDFDCDGYDDVAVGIPQEGLTAGSNAGAVNVIYGTSGGLSTVDDWYHQDVSGVWSTAAGGENFGGSLLAANFDGNTSVHGACDDLAVGVPGESANEPWGGAVHFFYGAESTGLSTSGSEYITQNSSWVEGDVEQNDQFATFLNAASYVEDAYDDIVVRAPYDTCGLPSGATGFQFFAGSSQGIVGTASWVTDTLACVYEDATVQSIADAYWACILDLGYCHCSDEFAFAIEHDTMIDPVVQRPWMCTIKAQAATEFCEAVTAQTGPSASPIAADCIEASAEAWKDCAGSEMEAG